MTFRVVSTLVVFAAMLVLVVSRPRGWSEAWWTSGAAALVLALGLVTPLQAGLVLAAGRNTLLFLLALLVLSLLIGVSGFFDWAAIHCARWAGGDARALYRNTFVLGALVSAFLSLDTTAVMLTPVVLALVKRVKVPALPYVVLCAMVANVGSLLFPVSNLTNLLFADAFHFSFASFVVRTALPQAAALVLLHALLQRWFRSELPRRFDPGALPEASSAIPSPTYFKACLVGLGVAFAGCFVAPRWGLEPWAVALGCSAGLIVAGVATRRLRLGMALDISWEVFPFVAGLFIAVRAVEGLGVGSALSAWLDAIPVGSPVRAVAVSYGTAAGSNLLNNLPAALLARGVLVASKATEADVVAALIGADIGPIVVPFGSLATMLVLLIARRADVAVPPRRLVSFGAVAALVLLATATGASVLVEAVLR